MMGNFRSNREIEYEDGEGEEQRIGLTYRTLSVSRIKEREGGDDGNSSTKNSRRDG